MIDLHCHSQYSDGLHTPEELVQMAVSQGVRYLALTDHDSVSGLEAIHEVCSKIDSSLQIINGIELTVSWKKQVLHLLGLHLLQPEKMKGLIIKQHELRKERARQIAGRLEALGMKNVFEQVQAIAGHDHIARPHFARLLLEKGWVRDIQTAFKRYLTRGKPAYVPTAWVSMEEGVDAIHQAGGLAVLAHPCQYNFTRTKLNECFETLKSCGGDGIEVVSGDSSPKQIKEMKAACDEYDFLASSGSDFHGKGLSKIAMGQQAPLPEGCRPVWQDWGIEQGSI